MWRHLSALLLVAAAPSFAGATFEANLGGGAVYAKPPAEKGRFGGGFSAPHFSIGGELREDLALAGRISMLFVDDVSYIFMGAILQYWPSDRFFLVGGLGLAQMQYDREQPGGIVGYRGPALNVRPGVNLRPGSAHRITLSLDLTAALYPHELAAGTALLIGYQYW